MSQRALGGRSPWEVLHDKPIPDDHLKYIHTFGARAYVILLESKQIGKKLSGRTEQMVYIDVADNGVSYMMYNPRTKRFIETREVYFGGYVGLPGDERVYSTSAPLMPSGTDGDSTVDSGQRLWADDNSFSLSSAPRTTAVDIADRDTFTPASPLSANKSMTPASASKVGATIPVSPASIASRDIVTSPALSTPASKVATAPTSPVPTSLTHAGAVPASPSRADVTINPSAVDLPVLTRSPVHGLPTAEVGVKKPRMKTKRRKGGYWLTESILTHDRVRSAPRTLTFDEGTSIKETKTYFKGKSNAVTIDITHLTLDDVVIQRALYRDSFNAIAALNSVEYDLLEDIVAGAAVAQRIYDGDNKPLTYEAATSSRRADDWQECVAKEMHSLKEMNTFTLCDLPTGRKPINYI